MPARPHRCETAQPGPVARHVHGTKLGIDARGPRRQSVGATHPIPISHTALGRTGAPEKRIFIPSRFLRSRDARRLTASARGPLILLALFSACNLTDGEDATGTTDTTITPDDTDSATPTDTTDGSPHAIPTVLSTTPLADATGVAINAPVTITFSESMDGTSLNTATLLLHGGSPSAPVAGTVIYDGDKATFWPAMHLASQSEFTATITTGAQSAAGISLEGDHSWTYTTSAALAPDVPVPLGSAGDFAVLAKSGISTVPASMITGDIGVSPAAGTAITGFSLTAHASGTYATSTQVTGAVYAADDTSPTPSMLTTAITDLEIALTDAASRAPTSLDLGAGNLGGLTLAPGVYTWSTGVLIPTDVTLSGSATDTWIFQIAQDLIVESGVRVVLAGGAVPENIFWQVSGFVDLGTTAHLEGSVLSHTAVTMRTGATLNGRLLARTAVALDANTIVKP